MYVRKAVAAEIYKTDLERHMFAPARRPRRRRHSPTIDRIGDWLRDWFRSGWRRRLQLVRAAG